LRPAVRFYLLAIAVHDTVSFGDEFKIETRNNLC